MTPSAYDVACSVIKDLAKRDPDLQCLGSREINPFFVIYACADCNVRLPSDFDRQLLWKHLDETLRAKCWRGLGSARTTMQNHTSADADQIPPKILRIGEDDLDDILQSLLRLSQGDRSSERHSRPVHGLQITIVGGYKWRAKGELGSVWYQAGDLHDEDDIACFALIDSLTRWLPSCRGGILEICTGHIRLLWGVGGGRSGAWSVVQAVCAEYEVKLRGKWFATRMRQEDPFALINPTKITVPPRDRDVVDFVVNEFMQKELLGSKDAYQCMVDHLLGASTT